MKANQITGTTQGFSSALSLHNLVLRLNHFTNGNDIACRYLPQTAKSCSTLQPDQKTMLAFTSPNHLWHSNKTATAKSCSDGHLLLPFLFGTRWLSEVLTASTSGNQSTDTKSGATTVAEISLMKL